MLEAIAEIGEKVLQNQDMIEGRIVKIGIEDNKGEPKMTVVFDFDIESRKFGIDLIEMDENTVFKYLNLGREGGPNANQWYVTFTNPGSLISESVSQLALKDVPQDIKQQLEFIINEFYFDFGKEVTPKYRYMLDLYKLGIIDENLDELYEKNKNSAKPHKEIQDYLQKELQSHIEKTLRIKSKRIALYTLSINKKPVATSQWYKNLIKQSFSETSKGKISKGKNNLCCSLCGSTEGSTSDLSKISIKYYTTNQVIFASDFNVKNYRKNMALCKTCYDNLLTGEKFIHNEMRAKISKLDVYVVPHFVYKKHDINMEQLYKLSGKLKQTLNTSNNIKNLEEYRNELDELDYDIGEGNYCLLNLIFYKRMNQATKILKLIKDVDPSIFNKIRESINISSQWFEKYFAEGITNRGQKGLNLVYYMTPVKLSQQSPAQYQNVLSIYEALFYRRCLNKREIISNITSCIKINWFEQGDYNVSSEGSRDFIDFKIADGLFYMRFLENMGNIERSGGMDVSMMNLNESYKNYIKDMNYDEQQTALFLLGCLIGSVGRKQSRREKERNKETENKGVGKYKPVLNKINFNGMDFSKVKRLSNDIFKKLEEEDILKYTEVVFAEHKRLMDLSVDKWKCNDIKDENLYYILSGYGYETMKKKEEKENE